MSAIRFRLRTLILAIAMIAVSFAACVWCYKWFTSPYVDREAPPIINAAQRGDLAAVKRLVTRDKSSLFDAKNRKTAAHWAILNGHNEIAVFLIESGYPMNPEHDSEFPLIMCCVCRRGQRPLDMLEYLLQNGADPNVIYAPEGWTPLEMAVCNGLEDAIVLLGKHGADPNLRDSNGETALEVANDRLAEAKDPNFNYPHGELSDPKVRQKVIAKWQRRLKLLEQIGNGEN